ncbi:MAG: phosphatidylglycerophosphatase A [Candidatus Omnitrophica bacterium]|nr:phosphatidylglycerophosphatase A [Candidatus Omnitrophota bacterium]
MDKNDSLVKMLSTFFYIGYLPFIPGTFASIFALFLFYLIKGNLFAYISLIFLLMLLGFLTTTKAEKIFAKKDPAMVVIDEVCGMLLSLVFVPYDLKLVIAGFGLFRIIDAVKPYPINKIQNLRGSLGIMGDDILSGLYTNLILQIVARLISFKAS